MKYTAIALALCACLCSAHGDLVHLKAAKAKLLGSLVAKARHHKRGVISAVPPFKLGYDIPRVSHSVVKPLVVTYPPTAAVATVKVPLTNPLVPRYPLPVGHRVPVPHPYYGLNFPHSTKSVLVSKPDHHFHHHHHHVSPKPVVPVVPGAPVPSPVPIPVPAPAPIPIPVPAPAPAPVPLPAAHPAAHFIPVAQPSAAVGHAAPPVLIQPAPVAPPPLHILPHNHLHLKPLVPAAVPIQQAPALPAQLFQYAHQFPYVLRHGGAVQTSVFATYPRYPIFNYQSSLFPIAPAAAVQGAGQVLLNRPQVLLERPQVLLERPQVPQFHLLPQGVVQGGVVQHATNVAVAPTPTLLHPAQPALPVPATHLQPALPQPALHLQPTQSTTLDHEGWSPVTPQENYFSPTHAPEAHFAQPQPHHQFTQEQGTQVYEQHTGDGQYDLHDQLQHHIQQQLEHVQYEQHAAPQPGEQYGAPEQHVSQQNHDYSHHGQEYAPHDHQYIPNDQQYTQNDQQFLQHAQQFGHHDQQFIQQDQQFAQHDQQYGQNDQQFGPHDQQFVHQDQQFIQQGQQFGQHDQQFSQNDQQLGQLDQQFAQHDQQFAQKDQQFSQHDQQFSQQGHEYELSQQPAAEYGLPQAEGRGDEDQQYHNHIPLGLQPPINEPLDHFR